MLRIHGRTSSLNTQKVMICVRELGLPHERLDAGRGFGVVDTPAYRAMNPNGLIPTISDDGFTLWESNAIIRYLCAKYSSGGLWPEDVRARAVADKWMDWQQTVLQKAIHPELHSLSTEPDRFPAERIEAARLRCESAIAMLEARLAEAPFVTGPSFGMADCALAPPVHRWMSLPIERRPHPPVEDWYARVMSRPAVRDTLPGRGDGGDRVL